jgi:hypothetical protein
MTPDANEYQRKRQTIAQRTIIGGRREELIRERLKSEQEQARERQLGCSGCRGRRITR